MNIWDIFSIATDGIRERKFRFALNIIGILIGCAAVTGLVSVTQGLQDEVTEQLEIFGPNNLMVVAGQIQAGRGIVGGKLSWKDLEIIKNIPYVDLVSPIIGDRVCQYNFGGKSYVFSVFGVTSEYFTIFKNYELSEGRPISRSDNAVAVIGASVAHPVNEEEPIIELGDRIKLSVTLKGEKSEMTFRVIGILEEVGGTFGSEDDNSIVIPLKICQRFYDIGGEFNYIALNVDVLEKVNDVIDEIEDKFGDRVTVMSFETVQDLVKNVLGTLEAVLGGIAAISLIVAGVGIINTMTISVMERTREIGVLKAIGAKRTDVLLMFLSEALVTGLIGGIIGALFGFILSNIVGNFINLPVSTSVLLGLGVTAFAILTCVLSGLYPAWRAARLNPVDALRYE